MPRRQDALPGLTDPGHQPVRRVRRAVDQQVTAQRAMGQIEPVDQALVAMARTLADAIDAEHVDPDGSRFTVGALSGRLLPVLLELRGERRDAASDVGYDAELAAIVGAIRDAQGPRPPDDW